MSQTMIVPTAGSIRHESTGPSQFTTITITITTAITIPKTTMIVIQSMATTMTLLLRIIGPLALSIMMMIIWTAGLSVRPSQVTTTTTKTAAITIPKTTTIIISNATTIIFFISERIITVPSPEANLSLILQPNATPKMTIPASLIQITKIRKKRK